MAATSSTAGEAEPAQLYTCMSCLVGFHSPLDQRTHYRSDLHRYNMKRQVAGLPPVRQDVFEQKVLSRQVPEGADQGASSSTAAASSSTSSAGPSSKRPRCQECAKSFASEGAYATHVNSRKHKDAMAKLATTSAASSKASVNPPAHSKSDLVFKVPASAMSGLSSTSTPLESVKEVKNALPNTVADQQEAGEATATDAQSEDGASSSAQKLPAPAATSLTIAEDATDAEVEAAIAARLASATRIDPSKQCIFCSASGFEDLDAALTHMHKSHGFFLPERPYITDLPGLAQYLADKVSVGHLCLYCNGRGRGFNTAEAARKHMLSKYHCKVAYDREQDKLELGDFYDFSSSYPDYQAGVGEAGGEEWEDMEVDGDEDAETVEGDSADEDDEESDIPDTGLRYGDNEYELILPSGARLGHRSLARYYRQTLFSTPASVAQSQSGAAGGAVARRLIDQGRAQGRNAEMVVRDRHGGEVRARNRGEAKEARRHVREFRDMHKREAFKTQVGFRHNSQKHFRDPLLQ
ncbi:unnamed protein product [Sympodiomycopsis kandeliae]